MPRKALSVSIVVNDLGVIDSKRKISIEVEGDANEFNSSDLCVQAEVVAPITKLINGAIREAITTYIRSGPELLRRLKSSRHEKDASLE